MTERIRRRTALGMVGTAALAGCSELGSMVGLGCNYGEGEVKQSFDRTIDFAAGASTAFDTRIEPCDELAVTVEIVEMLDDEPQDRYGIEAVIMDDTNYEEFRRTQEIGQYTMWDTENGSEDWSRYVSDKSTFVYRLESGREVWDGYLVLSNGPPSDGHEDRPVRVSVTGTVTGGG